MASPWFGLQEKRALGDGGSSLFTDSGVFQLEELGHETLIDPLGVFGKMAQDVANPTWLTLELPHSHWS